MKRHVSKHAVTIDTSKAKSNADVVKLCVKELGLVEVRIIQLYNVFLNW